MSPDTRRLVGFCLAELGTMTAFMAFPATLPLLVHEWGLSASSAGLVAAGYQAGYVVLVPLLAFLTDHQPAWRIYAVAATTAAAATAAFGLTARGLWTALVIHTLMGAGLAGTYMPGMRLVAEQCRTIRRGRAIGAYVGTFSLGTSVSLVLVGWVARTAGWRLAFLAAAVGPALAAVWAFRTLRPAGGLAAAAGSGRAAGAPVPARPVRAVVDAARAVRGNRLALLLIIGYSAHCWELFGVRAWLPAFLTATLVAGGGRLETAASRAATFAAAVLFVGGLANFASGALSDRLGRRRTAAVALALSGGLSCLLGYAFAWPFPALLALATLHIVAVFADSPALSAGITESADPRHLGATMALQAFAGFGSATVSTALFGQILDTAGWGPAFASLGAVALAGSLVLAVGAGRGAPRTVTAPGREATPAGTAG